MALVLAALVALVAATPAWAASSTADAVSPKGSITVENKQTDSTYTAYKIFDVTYADGTKTDTYAYSIDSTSPWFSAVQSYANTASNGLTLTQVNGGTSYVVETTENFSASAFAAYLRGYVDGEANPTDIANPGGVTLTNGVASNLDLGYWFVTTTTGALCNLTTTHPAQTIYDKNVIEFDKDVDDEDHTIEVGQVLTYTLTGKVPSTTGYTAYTYKVEDEMTSGLTLNQNVKIVFSDGTTKTVIVGTAGEGEVAYAAADNGNTAAPTVSYVAGTDPQTYKGFSVEFDMTKWQKYVNQDVTITYTATVNENAIEHDEENNKAKLTYSDNPNDSTHTDHKDDEEHLYSFNLVIDKYESGSTTKKLANAQFVLYKTVDNAKQYYYYNTTTKKVEWVAENALKDADNAATTDPAQAANITIITTDSNGAGQFNGLQVGTYQLLEVAAPDGYNMLDAPIKVELTATADNEYPGEGHPEPYALSATVADEAATVNHTADNVVTDGKDNDVTAGVANSTGNALPETGGMGTRILYTVGGVMLVGGAIALLSKRRLADMEK